MKIGEFLSMDIRCEGVRIIREKKTKKGFSYKTMYDPDNDRTSEEEFNNLLEQEISAIVVNMDYLELYYRE